MNFYKLCDKCRDIPKGDFRKSMHEHFDRLYNVTEYITEFNKIRSSLLIYKPKYYMMVLDLIRSRFEISIDDVSSDDKSTPDKFLCTLYFNGVDCALDTIENGDEYYAIYVWFRLREFINRKKHKKMLKRKNIQTGYFARALYDDRGDIEELQTCIDVGFMPTKSDFELIFSDHYFKYAETGQYKAAVDFLINTNIPKDRYEEYLIKSAYVKGDIDLLNYLIDKGIYNIIEAIDIKIPDNTCELINKLIALGMTTHDIAIFTSNIKINKN